MNSYRQNYWFVYHKLRDLKTSGFCFLHRRRIGCAFVRGSWNASSFRRPPTAVPMEAPLLQVSMRTRPFLGGETMEKNAGFLRGKWWTWGFFLNLDNAIMLFFYVFPWGFWGKVWRAYLQKELGKACISPDVCRSHWCCRDLSTQNHGK